MKKPVALIIMDGFGCTEETKGNAVAAANTPNLDRLSSEYPSTTIASQQTGIELRSIQHCCGGNRQAKTAGGFQWKRKDDNRVISSINKRTNFEVLQIDKETNQIIQKFKSPAEASKATGISNVGIANCCNNKQKTSGNFIWKYVEEKEIICNKKDKEN